MLGAWLDLGYVRKLHQMRDQGKDRDAYISSTWQLDVWFRAGVVS
jgi:hypothetical protein